MAHATAIAPDTLIQSRCHLRKDCRGVFALMTPIHPPAGYCNIYTAVAEKQFGALQNDTGESTEKEAWTLAGSPAIASDSSESSSLWLTTLEDHKKGKNHKKTIQLSRRHQSQCTMPQRMASFPPDRYTQRYNAQGLPKVFRNISAPPVCAVRKPRIQPPRPEPEPLSSLPRRL